MPRLRIKTEPDWNDEIHIKTEIYENTDIELEDNNEFSTAKEIQEDPLFLGKFLLKFQFLHF